MIRMASALAKVLLRSGGAAASERGAQTGHRGAVSNSGLIADANHSQTGGEEFLDEVVFFAVQLLRTQDDETIAKPIMDRVDGPMMGIAALDPSYDLRIGS